MFLVYNATSALVAFVLPRIALKMGRKYTHMLCLLFGGAGLISIFFIGDKNILLLPMIGIGLAWSSTLTMPYAILAGALPPDKMGFYMGVFNFFIVIPQILAAAILGFFIRTLFHDESIYALVIGGVSMVIAGFLNVIINDKDDKKKMGRK
jgi:maltose/moltooligosaccharide transporter